MESSLVNLCLDPHRYKRLSPIHGRGQQNSDNADDAVMFLGQPKLATTKVYCFVT